MSRGLDRKIGENMLGKTKIKLGKIGIEGIVVGIVLCMLIGMIPAQAAQAESTENMDDVQYTIYGTVYGIDGITPAKDVFVMATNNTGYGDYTYTDENGNYAIVMNWTYNIGDLVNVAAINGIRMGNASFTVTTNNSVEINIALQTIPEWWPSDPREISFESESDNSTSKTSSPTKGVEKLGQRNAVTKNSKANMETYNTDLVIPDYQEYENTELNLYQCDLVIESGGHLVLKNTTVTVWNNDTEGKYGISVLSNETSTGVLEVLDNSVIQAQSESGYYYHFNVYGNLLIDHSTIKWMSGEGLNYTNPDVTMPSGIRLYPDSRCTIQNNTVITNGRTHNIYADATKKLSVKDSAVLLAGNSTQMGYGVYATDASRVTINGSSVVGCANHGVYADECILEITRSRISENGLTTGDGYGVYCHSFSPTMSQNNITNNNGGIYSHTSSPRIMYNNITDNLVGVRADFSSPTISHNYIQDGKKQESTYGVYSYFSSFTADNNTISGYNFGFYLYYSPLTILNNHVLDNLIGVYLNSSGATIRGNNISGNYGAGIFSEYSTGVNIVENNLCENTPFGKLVESGILGEAEGYGVYAKKSSIVIENNNICGNGRAGVYYAESNGGVYHGTITGNTLNNHYTFVSTGPARTDGITIGTGVFCVNASLTISDNEISANVEGITSVSSSTTISSNDIDSNEGFSQQTRWIWVPWPPPHGSFREVTTTYTIGWGVYTEDSSSTVSNNNISENHQGIRCEYNSYTDIVNNNITSNDYGLWFDDSSFGDWSITDTSVVRDNEIWLNGNLTVYNGGSLMLCTTESKDTCWFMPNPKQDGMYQIEVLNGGMLTADNFGFYSATDYHYLFKVRDGAALTLTGWSGIGYCGYNSTLPENKGLFIESNNVLIENCWFQENYCGVILSGVDIDIVNTTFDYNTLDIYLRDASAAECLNTTFDETKVYFEDDVSILNVSWYLHVNVMNETGTGVEDASVTVYDNADNIVFEGQSDIDGWIRDIAVHEYTRNQTYTVTYTPHNITATKTGVGSAKQSNVTMDCSKAIALILENTLPQFSMSSVYPVDGYVDTLFTYKVTYTDEDNDPPSYVRVYIDNVSYEMEKNDFADNIYTDGCIYKHLTTLSHQNHTYYFEAKDWRDITTTPVFYDPEIINRPPYWVTTPPLTATAEYLYIYMAQAEDLDSDVLTYSLSVAPAGMSVNSTTGLVTWLPTKEQTGSNNVTLVADDGYGGIISQEFVITVYLNYPPLLLKSLPLVKFDEDATLMCAFNLSEYFYDINPEDIITYSYYGVVNVDVTINPNGTVDFSVRENWCGTETITFRATDPNGGYAECKVDITVNSVNDPPIVDAGLDQTVIANATYGKVRFTGTAYDRDGKIVLYEWDFNGDGNFDWSSPYTGSIIHIFPEGTEGNYTAIFRATDNKGETATDTCMIYVLKLGQDLPVAIAEPQYQVALVGQPVYVSAWDSYDPGWYNPPHNSQPAQNGTPGEIVFYDWNWRDVSHTYGDVECRNTSHVYWVAQDYEVVLTVRDNQSFTNTATCVVKVVYPPVADAGIDRTVSTGCKGYVNVMLIGKGTFDGSPHGTIVGYTWEFGDSTYGYEATTTHNYTLEKGLHEKIYIANLTVTDSYGFSSTDSCVIRVVDNFGPIADAGPNQEESTRGEDGIIITLRGSGYDPDGEILYYLWDFTNDGTVDSNTTDGIVNCWYSLEGAVEKSYTARLIVVDNKGANGTATCTIRLVRNYKPTVYIYPDYQVSLGNRYVNFSASASDKDGTICKYRWDYGFGWTSKESVSPAVSAWSTMGSYYYSKPTQTKVYTVKLMVEDDYGESSEVSVEVKVFSNLAPIVAFAFGDQAKYVPTEGNAMSFTVFAIDLDGSLTDLTVSFGDSDTDTTTEFRKLTDTEKTAFAAELEEYNIGLTANSGLAVLAGMYSDAMWMYKVGISLTFSAAWSCIPFGWVFDSIFSGDWSTSAADASLEAMGVATGLEGWEVAGAAFEGVGGAFFLAGLAAETPGLLQEAYLRGTAHSVDVFMRAAFYDIGTRWGVIEQQPLISREELEDRMVGYTVTHTYPPSYPEMYDVTATAIDDEDKSGMAGCKAFLFDNVPPFAVPHDEVGRLGATLMLHNYALDFEGNIKRWEWDLDCDGSYDEWAFGTESVIDNYNVIGPNITVNTANYYTEGGVYDAYFNVVDDKDLNHTTTCKIYIYPFADAGEDKARKWKKPVEFNGTGWTLDASISEYWWDFDSNINIWPGRDAVKRNDGKGTISKVSDSSIMSGWFDTTCSYPIIEVYIAEFGIMDNIGGAANDTCVVTVHENRPPIADAGPDQTVKWTELPVKFDATNSSDLDYGDKICNYIWDFGDGNIYGENITYASDGCFDGKTTHIYDRIGPFTVNLTVYDEDNATGNDSCEITVIPDAGPDQIAWVGDVVGFSGQGPETIGTWIWYFQDGTYDYGQRVGHAYSTPGRYEVKLIVKDKDDPNRIAEDICIVTVTDNHIPEVDAGADQQTYWGLPLTFYGTVCDGDYPNGSVVSYHWDFGDGTSSDIYFIKQNTYYYAFNYTHIYRWFGEYTVTLTAWDDRGAINSSTCHVVIVNPYGDVFEPKIVAVSEVPAECSYTELLSITINITDDCDPEPYIDVWLDNEWYTDYTIATDAKNKTKILTITMNPALLPLGSHALTVRSMDLNGNLGICTINFTVIDNIAPESNVNDITPYWHNNAVTITANASDERSNITNVTLYYYNSTDNSTWYGPFLFRTDNSAPWEWVFDFPVGEGYYRFYSIARDEAENQEIFAVNDTVCGYDITLPESEVNMITPYWQTNAVFTVTATANDNLSGVANVALYYRYSSDNATWSNWALYETGYNAPWEWDFNPSTLYGDGYYQVYTIATDVAGNMETAPEHPDIVCGVDTGMPVSQVNPIQPYWQTTTTFTVTADASNGMSGIAQVKLFYRYSQDNTTWGSWTPYGVDDTAPYEWLFSASDGDGYYEFYTIATDISGNIESASLVADAFCGVDTHAPCSFVNLVSPYWQNIIPFTITVAASDEKVIGGSGIAEVALYYRYSADNSSWSAWTLFSNNKTTLPYIWDFTAPDGDGYYQFYSIATDNAGNIQETPAVIIVCGVDTIAPTTTDNAPLGWQNTTLTVTLTPIDSLSSVAYTEYKLWVDGENEPVNWNMGIVIMINSDGIWNIKYRSVDNAGNMETNNTVQVQLDMTASSTGYELTGTIGDNNWFTTNVTVTLIATDMTSGVNYTKYRVDYGDWTMYDDGFELSAEGVHLIEYYSVDNAGNVEKVTHVTVKIDKTPPSTESTITGTMGENNWYTSDIGVNLSSSDATSGVNYTEYNLDGGGWQTYTGNFTVSSDGEHVLEYCSVDNAGNVETYKTVSFKIDQTPPTADNIVINNGDEYTNTTTVHLSLSASDSTSGMWMMQFKNELSSTWSDWIPYDISVSWIIQDMEGERTVYFRVKDMAGLISDETSDTITLDKTSPVIVNITSTPSVQEVHGYVNITAQVADNYKVDAVEIGIIYPNGSYTALPMNRVDDTDTYYYNVSYSVLGWYNFIITAKDLADNFATGEGNFFIGDTTKPKISNVQVTPEMQDVFDPVNITCNVTDNVNVKNVYVNITDPQGTVVSVLMENIEGTDIYYYNTAYQISGTSQYYIWAVDTSDNQNTSMVYTFNITRRTTTVIYTGDTCGQYSDNVTLSAILMDTKSNTPIFNRTLSFTLGEYNGVGVTDENGTCMVTFMLTQIPDIYPVTVVFSGDEYYLEDSIVTDFTVEKENTVLSSPSIDIVYSDDAILIITMTDEEGEPILHQTDEPKTIRLEYYNMTIWIPLGNATLINGTATFELSIPEDFDETAGMYDLRVRFNGDNRYNPANATGTLTILGENIVISDPSFTIVYSDNATVTIIILDDDNESLLHEEDVEIILEFYHTVWRLRMRWDPYTHEIIVYWVREGVWTEIDRITMINGSITFNVSIPEDFSETAGNYSLRAVFDGNNRYNAASTYGTLTILKENVVLSDPSFTIVYMNSTNVTINVIDDDGEELIKYVPSGPFIERDGWRIDIYYFNGTEWKLISTERLRNGSVTFDIFMPDDLMEMPGVYELMLCFDGNGTYNDAVRYGNLTIIGGETNLTYTGALSGQYSDDVLFSAILTDYFGEGMPNRTIMFALGNQTVNAITNETGVATATITLMQIPGNYTFTAEFLGDEYYFSSNTSIMFTIEKEDTILIAYDIVVSDPVNDTLTALLMEDSTPMGGRTIDFYINGTYVGSGITNESGIATCSVPFLYLFGNFTYMTIFTGDEYYLSSNDTAELSATKSARISAIITQINKLIEEIQNSNISNGLKNSLVSKLENARMKVTQENFNAADNIMNAFQNELEAQRGKGISEEQYQNWYSQSEDIRYALQWMMSH